MRIERHATFDFHQADAAPAGRLRFRRPSIGTAISIPTTSIPYRPVTPATTNELPAIPGGWTTRDFVLAGQTLRITLPASPDAFLDDPEVLAANRQSDYMPYWSYLWPTSLETAVAVLNHSWSPTTAGAFTERTPPPLRTGGQGGSRGLQVNARTTHDVPPSAGRNIGRDGHITDGLGRPCYESIHALEIGAGIALTGLAALARGLSVTFSDYDQRAIDLALFNARQNHLERNADGLLLDWRQPIDRQFPVIFGCDVIYEKRNHRPILGLLEKMLAREGECWITDPGRHQADAFLELLAKSPFQFRHHTLPREPYPGRPEGTTNVWVLTWR